MGRWLRSCFAHCSKERMERAALEIAVMLVVTATLNCFYKNSCTWNNNVNTTSFCTPNKHTFLIPSHISPNSTTTLHSKRPKSIHASMSHPASNPIHKLWLVRPGKNTSILLLLLLLLLLLPLPLAQLLLLLKPPPLLFLPSLSLRAIIQQKGQRATKREDS
jgi:hypothetical protein